MPLEEVFYSLKNIRFTMLSGLVADATEISIKRKLQKDDRTAGMSLLEQRVYSKEMAPDISVKGWNSADLHFADLIPGDPIVSFMLLSTENGTPSVLPPDFLAKWLAAGMCIGDTDTTYGDKPSQWTTGIDCGMLNPGFLSGNTP